MRRRGPFIAGAAAILLLFPALPGAAATRGGAPPAGAARDCPPASGFPRREWCGLSEIDARLDGLIRPERISQTLELLASAPRLAGSPEAKRMAEAVSASFSSAGLPVRTSPYRVLLPYPREVRLERTAPDPLPIPTGEDGQPGDEGSRHPAIPIPYLAFSPSGDVEGEIVYVNYGLREDFEALAAAGRSVAGRIALARYGKTFRGEKVRLAAEKGAAACILYSDPSDDGFTRGDVLPQGPWRPWGGVQRGSILTAVGDPLTPGWAAAPGARRLDPSEADLPKIPAMPISYASASLLLRDLGGPAAPRGWQGGLPFTYHLGPGPVRARLRLDMDFALRDILDVCAEVTGSGERDHAVILGAHRDSWGPGASDNGGGTAVLVEVARALGRLLSGGWSPRRTILLCSWDAEEFGTVGSTEWVEENEEKLRGGAVAYLNMDGAASGRRFEVSASPSLAPLFSEIASALPAPEGTGTLLSAWRRESTGSPGEPAVGTLGGGSDFAPFLHHLGVPAASHSFAGDGSGAYHSSLDTFRFVARFEDPGFIYHAAAAKVWASAAVRLASGAVLPYDQAATAREILDSLREMRGSAAPGGAATDREIVELREEAEDLARTAARLRGCAGRTVNRDRPPAEARLGAANAALIAAERAFVSNHGLPGRPWYRYLILAPNGANGYGVTRLPGLREALESGDARAAGAQAALLRNAIERANSRMLEAMRALR